MSSLPRPGLDRPAWNAANRNVTIGDDLLRISAALPRHLGESQGVARRFRQPTQAYIHAYKFHGAQMTKKNTKKNTTPETTRSADLNLDSRYGAIGISAVVAALQFKSEVKLPAHAPAVAEGDEERSAELAA
jgi:hypothetical protein